MWNVDGTRKKICNQLKAADTEYDEIAHSIAQ